MPKIIYVEPKDSDIFNIDDYSHDVFGQFTSIPEVAQPLLKNARKSFEKIEKMLYSAPAFINMISSCLPKDAIQAVLTDEQKAKLASGALKLMTKKDGTLMAILVDPETNKIVSTIPLKSVNVSPDFAQAVAGFTNQMQMAQIAQEIQYLQIAVEEIRQGQVEDRLAKAYSCQQKLIQTMEIKNRRLKESALLRIVSDAEDSRNLLMQSQGSNVMFIMSQPESYLGKLTSTVKSEKIDSRINEIRDSLYVINMVSLVEAIAYQEMGEICAAKKSLEYYAQYIHKTFLSNPQIKVRLDLLDPSPENYWSKNLPIIENKIQILLSNNQEFLTTGD